MNNSNGAALIARIRAGSIVTIREDGGQVIGRACVATGGAVRPSPEWSCITQGGRSFVANAGNVTRVQP